MSTETKNHKLFKYEDNDVADLRFLHNSMETIDKGLTLDVGTSTGTGNDYVLNLGSITLSSANKGISFKFWADKDSNGAVTINGTYNLVNANKNPIKNIKKDAPYTITYDGGTNFFLASGGVDDVNFSASDLLENKSANNSDGEKVNGTMKNVGQQTATINAGGKVIITKGYHNGTGYIQANSMSTQLNSLGVTLTDASQLVNGVKAVDKNGNVITGTATIQSLGGVEYKEIIVPAHPDGYVNKISLNSIGFKPSIILMEYVGGGDYLDSYIWLKNYGSINSSFVSIGATAGGSLDVFERQYVFYEYKSDTNQYILFQYSTSYPLRVKCYK